MGNDAMPVTGGCLCGAIRYEADQAPYDVGFCHCRMCQKSLGNLFGVAAWFKHAHFRFVSGAPTWYESSDLVKRGFCKQCGSPIAYQRNNANFLVIWMGTLDQPEAFEPRAHYWSDSKIPWVDIQSDLPDVTKNLPSYKVTAGAAEKD